MDDALAGCLGVIAGVMVGVVALGFVLWVVAATLLRILAWLVVYWIASAAMAAVVGVVTGLVVPLRVLTGRSSVSPDIAAPSAVHGGAVVKGRPSREADFPWDRAWPTYVPFQAERDATAVRGEVSTIVSAAWRGYRRLFASGEGSGSTDSVGGTAKGVGSWVGRFLAALLRMAVGFTPVAGFTVGVSVSFLLWSGVMAVIAGLVWVLQEVLTLARRWSDRLLMQRARAVMMCPIDYRTTKRPSYRCLNPDCQVIHRDISPGPLGIFRRRCECGWSFPTTVRVAGRALVPLCPYCDAELAPGTGTRRTIQIPTFGSVSAGKTRFLSSALVQAKEHLEESGGGLEPLSSAAESYLKRGAFAMDRGHDTPKTADQSRPAGRPFMVTGPNGRVLEIQVLDAAGERFVSWDTAKELSYLEQAPTLLAVLDPLSFPKVSEELARAHLDPVAVAPADAQEYAYSAVTDGLRQKGVRLSTHRLAVVLSKVDVVGHLPCGTCLDPSSSEDIRNWMVERGMGALVAQIERDFRDIRFFAVDSSKRLDISDPRNPVAVFDWVLDARRTGVALLPLRTEESGGLVGAGDGRPPGGRSTPGAGPGRGRKSR